MCLEWSLHQGYQPQGHCASQDGGRCWRHVRVSGGGMGTSGGANGRRHTGQPTRPHPARPGGTQLSRALREVAPREQRGQWVCRVGLAGASRCLRSTLTLAGAHFQRKEVFCPGERAQHQPSPGGASAGGVRATAPGPASGPSVFTGIRFTLLGKRREGRGGCLTPRRKPRHLSSSWSRLQGGTCTQTPRA